MEHSNLLIMDNPNHIALENRPIPRGLNYPTKLLCVLVPLRKGWVAISRKYSWHESQIPLFILSALSVEAFVPSSSATLLSEGSRSPFVWVGENDYNSTENKKDEYLKMKCLWWYDLLVVAWGCPRNLHRMTLQQAQSLLYSSWVHYSALSNAEQCPGILMRSLFQQRQKLH